MKNVNRLVTAAASASHVSIVTAHVPVSNRVSQVCVRLPLGNKELSKVQLAASIKSVLSNDGMPVLGSFRRCESDDNYAIGFVVANLETISVSEASERGLRPVTASLFLDKEDESVWNVTSSPDGQILVREGKENLSALLETARVRDVSAPELASFNSADSGDFIAFVDPLSGNMRGGMVLASTEDGVEVITPDSEETEIVSNNEIVDVIDPEGETEQVASAQGIEIAEFNSKSKASMKEYYKQVFSYSPEYIKQMMTIIDQSAVV